MKGDGGKKQGVLLPLDDRTRLIGCVQIRLKGRWIRLPNPLLVSKLIQWHDPLIALPFNRCLQDVDRPLVSVDPGPRRNCVTQNAKRKKTEKDDRVHRQVHRRRKNPLLITSLVPGDRLLRFSLLKKVFYQANETFFILHESCHLMLRSHLMEPN